MPDIVHRIGIRAPLEKVAAAVSSPEGVASWWTRETTTNGKGNAAMHVRFTSPEGKELGTMAFDVAQPVAGRKVHWRFTGGPEEWLGTDATFDLTRDGDMTLLIFGHRGWREPVEFMAHCSMKWAVFLLSLRQFVETGSGQPAPEDLKIDNWN